MPLSLHDSSDPVGLIKEMGASGLEPNHLQCDGAEYDPAVKVALFGKIGVTFNTGGETPGWFRVPDKRGRGSIGVGTGPGLTPRTLGNKIGSEIITNENLPSHLHTNTHDHPHSIGGVFASTTHRHDTATGTGAGLIRIKNANGLGLTSIINQLSNFTVINQFNTTQACTFFRSGNPSTTSSVAGSVNNFTGNTGAKTGAAGASYVEPNLVCNFMIRY